jgi:hypothetical protein
MLKKQPRPWPYAWLHLDDSMPRRQGLFGAPYCHVHLSPLRVVEVLELARSHGPMVALDAWQAGRCALCGGEVPLRHVVADHDHHHGWVRGLLCKSCNALESHGTRSARDARHRLALTGYLEHPPTLMLGLHVQYRDIRMRWRAGCTPHHGHVDARSIGDGELELVGAEPSESEP